MMTECILGEEGNSRLTNSFSSALCEYDGLVALATRRFVSLPRKFSPHAQLGTVRDAKLSRARGNGLDGFELLA